MGDGIWLGRGLPRRRKAHPDRLRPARKASERSGTVVETYHHGDPGVPMTDENAEYVVPVRWFASNPKSEAYWEKGMFAKYGLARRGSGSILIKNYDSTPPHA